ncbi:MAG: polyphosphate kinase 1 [Bacteroidetes bacterium]|nr:MAG: polyphosphate kinase 1 [Bacteroidota bacterium]
MADNQFTFLNRDLSWLSFNHRVLLEAGDESVPLYSRIQFLSIFSSNLDEFFRVRMPSIFAFTSINAKKTPLREEYPEDLVMTVKNMIQKQLEGFGKILKTQILPGLEQNNIHLYYGDAIRNEHKESVKDYFLSKVLSFIQPVILKKENQLNVFLENNYLYFIVHAEMLNEPGQPVYALLNIPSDQLPRFSELQKLEDTNYLLFLDDVIRENITEIFSGYKIQGAYSVKLTRDADLNLEDEFAGDIAEKIEKQLSKRDIGSATRFLFDGRMPPEIREFVKNYFKLPEDEMVEGGRYHNLKDLGSLPNPGGKKLSYENWPAIPHAGFTNDRPIFEIIKDGEKLLHLPYQSYNYILRFFNEAAIDPKVKEIYVTLYRVAANSHIVNALISAAKNGKKVTVFVELKARFDEANNIRWSKKMKTAGVKIVNSIPGLKVHAKVALISRYEESQLEHYSLMATGNFNESTAKFYTDHVFFTNKKEFSDELQELFYYLQSRSQPGQYGKINFKHLLVSQFNLVKRFRKMIDREIENAKAGLPANIIIKVNNLQEREMIEKLYEASNAGVKIQLIVRSICCVAPGIPGQSENITIHRIVDRYLEHARIFMFYNNGQPEFYMGSADWMSRNLFSRIEVVFPVYDEKMKEEISNILQLQLSDNSKAVLLKADLSNEKIDPQDKEPLASQEAIYNFIKERKHEA